MLINLFKIGSIWAFKYFFEDKSLFRELADYYNRSNYRFETHSVEDRDKLKALLESRGFEVQIVEDTSDFLVRIPKKQKYASILKNSVENWLEADWRVFLMKDKASAELAELEGAERPPSKK
ncbi:MAG: hypothetical protein ACUVXA_09090 [Candidatus Jordarchaeum sp.]|uniref:hypothetical protein n=1 Tax=Candidatus Jordarchaeum sp. TaxID=2823881 RepID=UPI00404A0256